MSVSDPELRKILGDILGPEQNFGPEFENILDRLAAYGALLRRWNGSNNLVSRETLPNMATRHLGDSVQVLGLFEAGDRRILDLGSGAGLPGIPIAIACPACQVTLLEANGRKVAFLRQAARELGLKLEIGHGRIEAYAWPHLHPPDLIVSRALARLPVLLGLAERFMGPRTRALFHKGRDYAQEIAESKAEWRYDLTVHGSLVAPDAAILEITGLSRR